jgi:competence protein ComGF
VVLSRTAALLGGPISFSQTFLETDEVKALRSIADARIDLQKKDRKRPSIEIMSLHKIKKRPKKENAHQKLIFDALTT